MARLAISKVSDYQNVQLLFYFPQEYILYFGFVTISPKFVTSLLYNNAS